jgi:hypothetical protein
LHRALLGLVTLYLLVAAGHELARAGAFGGEANIRCWSANEAPAEPFVHRVVLEGCHAHLGEMSYLRRNERVVGALIPLRSTPDASEPISVLVQVLDPELVARIVDDETPLELALSPELSGPRYHGQLIPRDKLSEGRRQRLVQRYDELDGAFRVLSLDARPAWTDGCVMLGFGLLGMFGWWRVRTRADSR